MNERDRWLSRARSSWDVLDRVGIRRRSERLTVKEPRGVRAVPLWPYSQVFHTATAMSNVDAPVRGTAHGLLVTLESYRSGQAYGERPMSRRRYFDDNAWIALAAIDYGTQESLVTSRRILRFLREGAEQLDGETVGIRWIEGGANFHACSTGSTGLVAARLVHRGVIDADAGLKLAAGCAAFMVRLQGADGLVRDHMRPDGGIDQAIFSYNQGLGIGLFAELGWLDEAVDLAHRTIGVFDDEALWKQPPVFNSILIRELMNLHEVTPHVSWLTYCRNYLQRVWDEARHPTTGMLRGGGIGSYDKDVLLDHAGLVHAMVALAKAIDA